MDEQEKAVFLGRVNDGQMITIAATSGRTFRGIYDGENTDPDDALYFTTNEGKDLRIEWQNVSSIQYTPARAYGATMMVPDEHPMSGKAQRAPGLRPHTTRNG